MMCAPLGLWLQRGQMLALELHLPPARVVAGQGVESRVWPFHPEPLAGLELGPFVVREPDARNWIDGNQPVAFAAFKDPVLVFKVAQWLAPPSYACSWLNSDGLCLR